MWVILNPRPESVVQFLGDDHVLPVITLHEAPCFIVAGHASKPQVEPGVRELSGQSEALGYVVEFVRRVREIGLNRFEQVN